VAPGRSDGGAAEPAGRREPTPSSVEEALAQAASHGRAAAAEALCAARALVHAAALAATGRPVAGDGGLGLVMRTLDELAASLAAGVEGPGAGLLRAVSDALDAEIARWEARARTDPDARAVLRAYLGLREILWEVGVRSEREKGRTGGGGGPRRRRPGARVQRVPIDDAGP